MTRHAQPEPLIASRRTALACLSMLGLPALLAACSSAPVSRGGGGGGGLLPTAPLVNGGFPYNVLPVPAGARGNPRLSLDEANDVTLYAISLVGTPYRYGGNTPQSGFDCSGLINYVYRSRASISAPRTVATLVNWGQPMSADELRSGDLVVFIPRGSVATHAGIYVGENRFVHAPSTGGTVRLDQLTASYWSRQQVAIRRP